MAAWLTKMVDAISGDAERRAEARRMLANAHRMRAKVELTGNWGPEHKSMTAVTTIEALREEDMVVAQPTVGGLTRPLATNETLQMNFVDGAKRWEAETTALGRVILPSGGSSDKKLYGYRLAYPLEFRPSDRREDIRVTVGFDIAPKALLFYGGTTTGHKSLIIDISVRGAKVRTLDTVPKIVPGADLLVTMQLPDPVGTVTDVMKVMRVQASGNEGNLILGLAFSRPIALLEEFVASAATKRSQRGR
ncbi:MAG TPA: PilZ domain-containing protein [Phycisphaerales bacterium]|nr:PilZ domain-containing protein [Phycisphaerales bacterium]